MTSKIHSIRRLQSILATERKSGKKIVACSGSFDILTAKHVELLRDFRKQGDVLVVFLNSDASVRSYKGPHRPIMSESDRACMLAGLESVDYVCLFDEINPLKIIASVEPTIYCNGGDWGGHFLEKDLVEGYGGKVYSSRVSKKASTSDVIARIGSTQKNLEVRAIFLDRDGIVIEDKGYVHQIRHVTLMPGIVPVLKHLQRLGYLLIIITNQSGIGRKMFSRTDAEKVNAHVVSALRTKGVVITTVYYCPHAPDAVCACRKPAPGMLIAAAQEHKLSLARSYMIGDKPSDIEAGKVVNCKTILVGRSVRGLGSKEYPHFVAKSVREITKIITH